jgi:hypothetical protein
MSCVPHGADERLQDSTKEHRNRAAQQGTEGLPHPDVRRKGRRLTPPAQARALAPAADGRGPGEDEAAIHPGDK